MKPAIHRSLESASSKRTLRSSLASCIVIGLALGMTACGESRDGAAAPPAFNGLEPGDDAPAPPAGVDDPASDPASPNTSGDQPTDGLPLSPTDDDPAVDEPSPDEPPVEEPSEPGAPLCTPLANPGSATDGDVNVNLDSELQTITGFGGITMVPFFSGSVLTPGQVDIAFGQGPGQLGLSILRYPISDNPSEWDDEVPAAQRAVELGAMVFATPWTPPANLKSNNSTVGGFLLPQNYGAYTDHLLAFRDAMAEDGVPIAAISVQNEPDIGVDYDSCDWTAQQISDFLVQQGARFGDTRVIASESFNFNVALTDPILNDAQAVEQFDIVGGHLYGRAPFDYALARQRGKEVWMTEHYTDSGSEPDRANQWPLALDVAAEMHASMAANHNAYVWWYIRRGYGLILDNEQVSKRGWLFSQYSRFVRPGFVRVEASDPAGVQGVDVTAYKDGPGKVVVVALNQATEARTINLDVFGSGVTGFDRFTTSQTKNRQDDGAVSLVDGRVQVTLDAQSLTTFVSRDVTPQ
jgi:glucuronoarabinoxylan endo-1,4-beta-xylanase